MTVNCDLERCGRKRLQSSSRHHHGIFVDVLRKATKALSRDNRRAGRDSNRVLLAYKQTSLCASGKGEMVFWLVIALHLMPQLIKHHD